MTPLFAWCLHKRVWLLGSDALITLADKRHTMIKEAGIRGFLEYPSPEKPAPSPRPGQQETESALVPPQEEKEEAEGGSERGRPAALSVGQAVLSQTAKRWEKFLAASPVDVLESKNFKPKSTQPGTDKQSRKSNGTRDKAGVPHQQSNRGRAASSESPTVASGTPKPGSPDTARLAHQGEVKMLANLEQVKMGVCLYFFTSSAALLRCRH